MDLILLQPGDETILGKDDGKGSLIDPSKGVAPWGSGSLQGSGTAKSPLMAKPFIELISVHQGMKQQMTTDVSNQARTSGRPIITEFTCVKYVDAASVKLYDYCLRAKPLGTSDKSPTTLYLCRNSGEQLLNLMTFQLRDAMISEIQMQTHPDDMPTEQFKLNFTEVIWTFNLQKTEAQDGGALTAGWSVSRNAPIAGRFVA